MMNRHRKIRIKTPITLIVLTVLITMVLPGRGMATVRPKAVIQQFQAIFAEAHVSSQWYVNPGESRQQIDAKAQQAKAAGQLQTPTGPNTRYEPR